MTILLGEVIGQLRAAVERLDAASITARRSQEDVEHAYRLYVASAGSSSKPDIRAAISESRTAAEKASKVARLASVAATHLAAYTNTIAPGSMQPSKATDSGTRSGEEIANEAESRGSKAEAFLRRHVKKADETEGNLQNAEKSATAGFKQLAQELKGGAGGTGSTTSTAQPKPVTPAGQPVVEHPVTAVIMATGAAIVGIKGLWNAIKKRQEGKRRGSQP
ncbi:hypothetical protein V6U90_25035 [Micromonospora sp. CPCC 206060]|uniref:hypothetical protein n=1 Tax=Micromonospora sp. CPCC 206060 TaxID=3122406 RepID=UPI002FF1BF1D